MRENLTVLTYYKRFKLGDESLGIKPGLHEPQEVLACTYVRIYFCGLNADGTEHPSEKPRKSLAKPAHDSDTDPKK